MTKVCTGCGCTMPYDPYFKAFVCRQCGTSIAVSAKAQATITPSGNHIVTKSARFDGSFKNKKVILCK